jgi:hypothetical protein
VIQTGDGGYAVAGNSSEVGLASKIWLVKLRSGAAGYSVSGMKFNDLNGNGKADKGEDGIAGWKIDLIGVDNSTTVATTDADGNYKFEEVPPGNYTLKEEAQQGWIATYPQSPGTHSIAVFDSDISGADFGNRRPWVTGLTFNDLNANGARDANENGTASWTVVLTKPDGKQVTAVTDAKGAYRFRNLPPKTYTVTLVAKIGWTQTYPPAPGTYTLEVTDSDMTDQDFGVKQDVFSITGVKFNDLNGNGKKDKSDPGLQAGTIVLTSPMARM